MTFLYAALTTKRLGAASGTSTEEAPPGLKTYLDALAALVPAEVLAIHGAILGLVTQRVDDSTTRIVDVVTLRWAFVALLLLSAGLYVAGRIGPLATPRAPWDRWDWVRMCIPPLAFVGWTMLQRTTAFDAVAPMLAEAPRFAIAIIGGAALAVVASMLGWKADQATPTVPVSSVSTATVGGHQHR